MVLNCKKVDPKSLSYFKELAAKKVIQGYISGMAVGEFDPYLIGDACLRSIL